MPVDEAELLRWIEMLTGLPVDYVKEGRERISSWRFQHVDREPLAHDVDSGAAAALLAESIAHLVERGIPESRLLKKLRDDLDVWPTSAEIRAADIMLYGTPEGVDLALEVGRGAGPQADFRFSLRGEADAVSVEFKAIGLSDAEVAFCRRMMPVLERMVPQEGLGTSTPNHSTPPLRPPSREKIDVARSAKPRRKPTVSADFRSASAARRLSGMRQGLRTRGVSRSGWARRFVSFRKRNAATSPSTGPTEHRWP